MYFDDQACMLASMIIIQKSRLESARTYVYMIYLAVSTGNLDTEKLSVNRAASWSFFSM